MLSEDSNGRVKWVGGDTTVVQLGDVLDRGDSEIGGWCRSLHCLIACLQHGAGPWPSLACCAAGQEIPLPAPLVTR